MRAEHYLDAVWCTLRRVWAYLVIRRQIILIYPWCLSDLVRWRRPQYFSGLAHTKVIGNRKATAISENCYQPELNTLLNGVGQIEETATQRVERLTNASSRQRSMPVF
jgi:hypothetical protein